jgi:hypothetical protein
MSYESDVLALSPLAYWRLDSSLDDESGNGHTGVNVGGTFVSGGVQGSDQLSVLSPGATFYAPESLITAADTANIMNHGSVAFWVSSVSFSGTGTRYLWFLGDAGGDNTVHVRKGSSTGFLTIQFANANGVVNKYFGGTEWTSGFVVVTWDTATSQFRYYRDGAQISSIALPAATGSSSSVRCTFMAYNNGGANQFPGILDEPALFDYALSAAQVAALYAAGIATGGFSPFWASKSTVLVGVD